MEGSIVENSALELITRAEIDQAVATAKRYPRDPDQAVARATKLACRNQDLAGTMGYRLERKDKGGIKIIEGPSVRLAEVMASTWGNLRCGARVLDIGKKFVVVQGVAIDVEANNHFSVEVTRRITTKDGHTFGDDMIGVTCNAACSIGLRQAIFKAVPMAYVQEVYGHAMEVFRGKAADLEERREKMLRWYSRNGATIDDVLRFLDKRETKLIDLDDVLRMLSISEAIKTGESTMEAALARHDVEGEQGSGNARPSKVSTSSLNDTLGGNPPEEQQPPFELGAGDPPPHHDDSTEGAAKRGKGKGKKPAPVKQATPYQALRARMKEVLEAGDINATDGISHAIDTGQWTADEKKGLREYFHEICKALAEGQQ